jgi:hypothetical protein
MQRPPVRIFHPSTLGAGGGETRQVRDQQRAARLQDPRHLANGGSELGDIDQRDIADDEVEACIFEFELLGAAQPIITERVALPCHIEQRLGRIDAGRGHAGGLQHPAEAPLPATDIQRITKPAVGDTAEHDGV